MELTNKFKCLNCEHIFTNLKSLNCCKICEGKLIKTTEQEIKQEQDLQMIKTLKRLSTLMILSQKHNLLNWILYEINQQIEKIENYVKYEIDQKIKYQTN